MSIRIPPAPPARATRTAAPAIVAVLAVVAALALVAVPAAAQQPCASGYTIRAGDTIREIATRCGVTVPALIAANPGLMDNQDLEAGGRLRMPPPGMRPSPFEACGGFYTVRPGDTLEEVAEKCGLTVPLLIAVNPGLEDPDNMTAGARLRIPDVPAVGPSGPPMIIMRPPDTAAAPALDTVDPEPFLRYEGVLRRGEQCLVLRLADGTDIGMIGPPARDFSPGDRIAVTGPAAAGEECGTDRAVEVRILWKREG